MSDRGRRLVPLSEATDYSVNDGAPDVRGWRVRGGDDAEVGTVIDLLVDRAAGRVRYVEIGLAEDFAGAPGNRVLVPVGFTSIDPDDDVVRVVTVTAGNVRTLRVYDGGTITRAMEVELRRGVFGASELPADLGEETAGTDRDAFYDHEHFDERRLLAGRRRGDTHQDFGYLLGVGGAMTEHDVNPEVVGEIRAGQVSIPLVREETRRSVAPEE